jgi:hypothetical protein
MTTFTTEELHTDTERVLATTVREGYTLVAGVDGYRIEIRALPQWSNEAEAPRKVPDILARLRRQGMPRIPKSVSDAVDQATAGE